MSFFIKAPLSHALTLVGVFMFSCFSLLRAEERTGTHASEPFTVTPRPPAPPPAPPPSGPPAIKHDMAGFKTVAAAASKAVYSLIIRGPFTYQVNGDRFTLAFNKGRQPSGNIGENLKPQHASWLDRGMRQAEPTTLTFVVSDPSVRAYDAKVLKSGDSKTTIRFLCYNDSNSQFVSRPMLVNDIQTLP